VVNFSGWTDAKTDFWTSRLQTLGDTEAAMVAANDLLGTHPGPGVPPWAVFKQAYDGRRRALEEHRSESRRALEESHLSKSHYPTFEEGVEIAWTAYQDECRLRGRVPEREYFDSILSGLNRQARREAQRAKARR
jgi:hypothetical protein